MNDITRTEDTEEAKLLQAALKAASAPGSTTDDPSFVALREQAEKASPGIIERIRQDGLPSLEECVVFLRAGYELGKQAHALATKMGWIGVKK